MIAAALAGLCQVRVEVRTNQASYLAGEPIFAAVDVTNIGTEPLGQSGCSYQEKLSVPDGATKHKPNLFGCFHGSGGNTGGGVYDLPLVNPGQTVTCWYLLKGYSLRSGAYALHVSGKAAVFWKSSPHHAYTDPVEGQVFDQSTKLVITDAPEAELRQRYAAYVADAEGWDIERRRRARAAMAETAPPFLEKTLLGFASQPEDAHLTVEGLGQIPTDESRSDLIALFDKSPDLRLRADIVEKLAGIGTIREATFFNSLLAGRSTELDDRIREFAALGLGRIGGKEAVEDLKAALQSPNPRVRAMATTALGNTKNPAAIPVLIGLYPYPEGSVGNDVCAALMTLTHYRWCNGGGTAEETRVRWSEWWRRHATQLPLYGPDQCPVPGTSLPEVR